jgi:hypothetical protein
MLCKARLSQAHEASRLEAFRLLEETQAMATHASFNWIDPLLLDQQLTEEERMVRDSAAQFANASLSSRAYGPADFP